MDTKTIVAALVGLAAGLLIGIFAIPKDGGEETATTRGGGDPTIPPSVIAEDMPDGAWPKVECGGGLSGLDMLDKIHAQAVEDLQTGQITPTEFQQVVNLVYGCALNNNDPFEGDDGTHCQKVAAAMGSAEQHDWPACIGYLEHDH